MRDFSLNLPVNSVSFGQVSVALLREFHARGLQPCLFPIGDNLELGAQDTVSEDFNKWIASCIKKRLDHHSRSNPIFKLWHLNGSLESFSEKQILLSFHELDEVTPCERNIAQNNNLAFASFDVFEHEPAFKSPLLKLDNFFASSHRASLTDQGIESMGIAAINGLGD